MAAQIGIIIPAYNAEAFLAETLNSVLCQTFADWTCTVVDDGSTDGTWALAERYATEDQRIRVLAVPHGGQAAARNAGATLLPPDVPFVIFLDADDVWEPDALAILRAALLPQPGAVAAAALLREIDEKGRHLIADDEAALRCSASGYVRHGVSGWRLVPWPDGEPTTLATLAVELHIKTPGQVLIRMPMLCQAGPFLAAMSPSEDWDFLLRLALLGPILQVPAMLLRKRRVAGSLSLQPALMRRAEPSVRRAWAARPGLSKAQRHTLRLGHLYGTARRFAWAREALGRGRPGEAARHAARGVRAVVRCALIEGRAMVDFHRSAAWAPSLLASYLPDTAVPISTCNRLDDIPRSENGR